MDVKELKESTMIKINLLVNYYANKIYNNQDLTTTDDKKKYFFFNFLLQNELEGIELLSNKIKIKIAKIHDAIEKELQENESELETISMDIKRNIEDQFYRTENLYEVQVVLMLKEFCSSLDEYKNIVDNIIQADIVKNFYLARDLRITYFYDHAEELEEELYSLLTEENKKKFGIRELHKIVTQIIHISGK